MVKYMYWYVKRGLHMAKKQLTPEQYKEKMEKKELKSANFSLKFMSALAFLMAVVITVGVVSTAYRYAGTVAGGNASGMNGQSSQSVNSNVSGESLAPENTDDSLLAPETTPDNGNDGEQGEAENAMTTEEIVAYFNTSANKIKTDATKVVKNYEKRIVGELKVPDALQATAESIISSSMKDDTEPIVYATKQEIRDNFLVPNQDYVSVLKAEYVETAICNDKGKEYEIYFKLKPEKNSTSGKGVGSVCDVIEAYEVQEKAPSFLKEFSTSYYNCEVKAIIDKESGRVTHITYSTPVTLNVVVSLLGTHSATIGFTFVKDYTITY